MPPDSRATPEASATAADSLAARREQRRLRWFIVGSCTLLLGILAVVYFHDDPLPDDAWMMPNSYGVPGAGPGPANPLEVFAKEIVSLPPISISLLPRSGDHEEHLREWLTGYQPHLEAWERLMQSDPSQWRLPHMLSATRRPADPDIYQISYLHRLLLPIKSGRLNHEGRRADSIAWAMKMIRFARGFTLAESDVYCWMEGVNASEAGYTNLLSTLAYDLIHAEAGAPAKERSPEEIAAEAVLLRSLQAELATLEPSEAAFAEALRRDYAFWRSHILHEPTQKMSEPIVGLRNSFIPLLLRRQRTVRYYSELITPFMFERDPAPTQEQQHEPAGSLGPKQLMHAIAGLEKSYTPASEFHLRMLLNPNAAGESIATQLSRSTTAYAEMYLSLLASWRLFLTQIALRRYELAHGTLPEDLTVLVPTLLPAIPLDPYTGKPLVWRRESQKLYSTGLDATDHGGNFNVQPGVYDRDQGDFYKWGEAMRKDIQRQREESARK